VPDRPLVFVSGLTFGDYLLWNWSLNSNHAVLELVSGLTLPPLAVVWLWLVVLTVARLIAHGTGRSLDRAEIRRDRRRGVRARTRSTRAGTAPGATPAQAANAPAMPAQGANAPAAAAQGAPTSAAPAGSSPGKLAA
jgi:hypothetical protein